MKLELVMHVNQMSLDTYPTDPDGKVYCRKNNRVMITTMEYTAVERVQFQRL